MIATYTSENGVDKWIRENVFTDFNFKGVLVEVGAATPYFISNSYHFRINGWRTISIEPNPEFVELHRKENSEVYEYACSDEDKDDVLFTIVSNSKEFDENQLSYHAFSHISDNSLMGHDPSQTLIDVYKSSPKKEIKIKVRKLDTILNEIHIDKIDILCVDTEGNEMKVLDGFNIEKFSPKIIILENLHNHFNFVDRLSKFGYHKAKNLAYDEIFILK